MADNADTGMAWVSVAGQTVRVAAALTWDPGTVDRETQKGMDGVHGRKLSPRVPFISLEFRDSSAFSIAGMNDIDSATIFAQLVSGKTVNGAAMWQVGPTEVNSEEGTSTIRFEGPQGAVREGLAS